MSVLNQIRASDKLFVLGNNEYTQQLIKLFPVHAIIDETVADDTILGLPNVKLDSLDSDSCIINTVHNSRANVVQARIESLGYTKCHFIGKVISAYPEAFSETLLGQFQHAMRDDFQVLSQMAEEFEDDRSKEEFLKILEFRRSLDIEYLRDFEVKIYEQYFEPFLIDIPFNTFIDGGAFDGQDSIRFAGFNPDYEKISILEPSAENLIRVKERLKHLEHIEYINACLSSSRGKLGFSGEGTSSKIDKSSEELVDVITLSDINTLGKTLVKMDIEGAEVETLTAVPQLLDNPDYGFAISSYHLPHDLLNIMRLMLDHRVDRKLYFRHYSGGYTESVIFAL